MWFVEQIENTIVQFVNQIAYGFIVKVIDTRPFEALAGVQLLLIF